jgi:hypothetical protein
MVSTANIGAKELVDDQFKLKAVAALGDELFKKTVKFLQLIQDDKDNITLVMIEDLEQLLVDIIRFTEELPNENQEELTRHVDELRSILLIARKALEQKELSVAAPAA